MHKNNSSNQELVALIYSLADSFDDLFKLEMHRKAICSIQRCSVGRLVGNWNFLTGSEVEGSDLDRSRRSQQGSSFLDVQLGDRSEINILQSNWK